MHDYNRSSSRKTEEVPVSIRDFRLSSGLRNIPKAEFNMMLGLPLFLIFVCFSDNEVALGLLFLFVINYFGNDKRHQDVLVDQYMSHPSRGCGANFYKLPEIQKIIKGLTPSLFRESGTQNNLDVLHNAVASRVFTRK
ncbi:MAG: hypothetical protein ACD_42C00290G0006 [uncultured bacterium]|nr:MAG: hypothetical protein ACD_42C00290G0006 [uncultured bacterium]OGT32540.1 MAG: hypothetical protein A3C44_02205 [Gammaproteobacteria bacterium RIFCSPHIGHO2_02_FULL_39_13]OGT48348.1 MAG: hypothetical protein A3E53_05900 [Gammaproteobacteria bacterium RIFCSPHIGHO2_12_FULL_39_24]